MLSLSRPLAFLRSTRLSVLPAIALLAAIAAAAPPETLPNPNAPPKTEMRKVTLVDCIRIANERQPTIAAARASLAARLSAKKGVDELTVPKFLAPDLPIRRQQAVHGLDAAYAELYQAEYDTAYAVIRMYYTAVYARQQNEVAEEVVQGLTFWRDLVGRIVQGGGDPNLNQDVVDRLNIHLKMAEAKQAQAQSGVERALAALREAMGVDSDCCDFATADDRLPTLTVKPDRDTIVALAVARRGELVQATAAAAVTRLEICAQSKFKMRPQVRTFASSSDIHAKSLPTGLRNGEYRPGAVGIEMPANVAGSRESRMDQVRDYSARSDAVVEKTRRLITLEAVDAYEGWREATRAMEANREAAQLSRALATRIRNNSVNAKKEDLLQADVLAGQAQAAYNEALYRQVLALTNLERITAGGFDAGIVVVPPVAPAAPTASIETGPK